MDDHASALETAPQSFLCPGESHPIDRTIHLARLAAFYPACRECSARHETQGLTPLQLRARTDVERQPGGGWSWDAEGLAGTTRGELDRNSVARFATALAAELWQRRSQSRPTVLVGSDGRWVTADLMPVVCRALQLAGCLAIEVGSVTTPCLVAAQMHEQASAALWIGNATGGPHALALTVFLEDGRPASSPGALDIFLAHYESGFVRPKRNGGGLQRLQPDALYLAALAGAFHGLRPLVIALDTGCEPLLRHWQKLSAQTACRIVRLEEGNRPAYNASYSEAQLNSLSRQVIVDGAHFGIWIDGQGECLRLVDERGEPVESRRVSLLLKGYLRRLNPGAAFMPESSEANRATCSTRQQMHERMTASHAAFGRDGDRYWFAGPPAVPDALAMLCLLLQLLSESDRTLAEVLDSAATAE
jgi:phosphomannomutase